MLLGRAHIRHHTFATDIHGQLQLRRTPSGCLWLFSRAKVHHCRHHKSVSRTFTPLLVSKDTPSSASNSPGGAPGLCALQVMGVEMQQTRPRPIIN